MGVSVSTFLSVRAYEFSTNVFDWFRKRKKEKRKKKKRKKRKKSPPPPMKAEAEVFVTCELTDLVVLT